MAFFETAKGMSEIVYEDRDVLAFIKPAGILSTGAGGERSVLDYASEYTGGEVYPVHRLDRGTGGIMLAAKTKLAASALSAVIADGGIKKEYLAAVNGIPKTPCGILEDDLYFDRKKDKSFVVKPNSARKGVKHASLEYTTVCISSDVCGREAALLRILLHTGRTHQIRVQMANMGHPLMGDGKYGGGNCRYGCVLYSHKLTVDAEAIARTPLAGRELGILAKHSGPLVLKSHPTSGIWDCFT